MQCQSIFSLWKFYLAWFIDCLGQTCIYVELLYFIDKEFNKDGAYLGFVLTLYASMLIFGNVIAGRLTDRFEPRNVLAGILLWNSVTSFLTALSSRYEWILVARCLAGMLGSTTPIAYAYVGRRAGEGEASRLFSMIGSLYSLAYIIVPIIINVLKTHLLSDDYYGRRSVFFISSIMFLTSFTFVVLFVEPSRSSKPTSQSAEQVSVCDEGGNVLHSPPNANGRSLKLHVLDVLKDVKYLISHGGFLRIWLIRFFGCFGQLAVTCTLWVFCEKLFSNSIDSNSNDVDDKSLDRVYHICLAIGGLSGLIASSLVFNLLISHLQRPDRVLKFSLAILTLGVSLNLFALHINRNIIYASSALLWLGASCFDISIPAVIRYRLNQDKHAGLANGVATSFKNASQVLSPLIANIVFKVSPTILFAGATFFCLTALGLSIHGKSLEISTPDKDPESTAEPTPT